MTNKEHIANLMALYCMGKMVYHFDDKDLESIKYAIDKLREMENEKD